MIKHSSFASASQQLANVAGNTLYVGNRNTCDNIVFETKDLAITLQSINEALSAIWLDTTGIVRSGLVNNLENFTCYRAGKIVILSGRIFFSGASFNNEVLLSNLPVNCYGAYFTINSYGINGETGEVTGFLIDNVITGLGAPSANREYRFEVVSAIR